MTFNQVNYFLAVARFHNFTRAAAALFVTQSTLSRSVAALEDELGVKLLDRDFHSVKLTPAGELLYKEMQGIMDNITGVINRVQALGDKQNNHFTIGILEGQSVDQHLLHAIRVLSDQFPNLSVDIQRMYHHELLENIRTGQFDVAETILSSDTILPNDIDSILLSELNNYLVIQQEDPLCESTPDISILSERTLIAPSVFHPGLEEINQSLRDRGIEPKIKLATDMETQALWLESGMGVYIANEENVIYTSRTFRPLRVYPLTELPKSHEVLIWNRKNTSPVLENLLPFVRQESAKGKA